MLDPDVPAGVRLDASEKRLDRLLGKAPLRIEVSEEIPRHQQMMQQIRRTPEGRAAVRELVRQMREAAKPAIDVTPGGTTRDWPAMAMACKGVLDQEAEESFAKQAAGPQKWGSQYWWAPGE